MKKILYFILFLFLILAVYSFIQDRKLGNRDFKDGSVYIDQKEIKVSFVSKETLFPAFGMAYTSEVKVREDLPPRIKRFVLAHELYHIGDRSKSGWIGREIKANLIPAMSDPIGFIQTSCASLTPTRLSYYFQRFLKGR